MKKSLLFVSAILSASLLAGCDLTSLYNRAEDDYNNIDHMTETEIVSESIHFAKFATLFLDVDEEYDFSEYMTFEAESGWKVADYQIKSLDEEVLEFNNGYIKGLKEGFTYLEVTGPGIEGKHRQRVYVGSIAGEYVSSQFPVDVKIELEEENHTFIYSVTSGVYHGEDIEAEERDGTWTREGVVFLCMDFGETRPTNIDSLEQLANGIPGVDVSEYRTNGFGFLTYEENVGLQVKVNFRDNVVTLTNSAKKF